MSLRDAARQAWLNNQQASETEARIALTNVLDDDETLVDSLNALHVSVGNSFVRWFFEDSEGTILRVSRSASSGNWSVHLVREEDNEWINKGEVTSLKQLWELLPISESDIQEWEPGGTYVPGDIRSYDGVNYKCIQGHTNHDPNHTPPLTPALWEVI